MGSDGTGISQERERERDDEQTSVARFTSKYSTKLWRENFCLKRRKFVCVVIVGGGDLFRIPRWEKMSTRAKNSNRTGGKACQHHPFSNTRSKHKKGCETSPFLARKRVARLPSLSSLTHTHFTKN